MESGPCPISINPPDQARPTFPGSCAEDVRLGPSNRRTISTGFIPLPLGARHDPAFLIPHNRRRGGVRLSTKTTGKQAAPGSIWALPF